MLERPDVVATGTAAAGRAAGASAAERSTTGEAVADGAAGKAAAASAAAPPSARPSFWPRHGEPAALNLFRDATRADKQRRRREEQRRWDLFEEEEAIYDQMRGASKSKRKRLQGQLRSVQREMKGTECDTLQVVSVEVTDVFKHLCRSQSCSRGFGTPTALLEHLQRMHKSCSQISRLQSERRCPCGQEFADLTALSDHVKEAHNAPTANQQRGYSSTSSDDDEGARRQKGGHGGRYGGGGGSGGGWSSDDDDGACGFSRDECNDLLAQGVKPWDADAGDVLGFMYRDF